MPWSDYARYSREFLKLTRELSKAPSCQMKNIKYNLEIFMPIWRVLEFIFTLHAKVPIKGLYGGISFKLSHNIPWQHD